MDGPKLPSWLLPIALATIASADVCTISDPLASCECHFDGLHFGALCARTNLASLPRTRDLPADLELLDVSHNRIASLRFDDARYVARLLRVFRASRNRIADVAPRFFAAMPRLVAVDLSHNALARLDAATFADVVGLHRVDLSHNNLRRLPADVFLPLRGLRTLDVGHNDAALGAQLADSSLVSIVGATLDALKMDALNLSGALPADYFARLPLTSLSLADNALTTLPTNLPLTLTTLDLSGNSFVTVAARDLRLPELVALQLNRLPALTTIGDYAFYNLPALRALEIEHCPKLATLNDMAFGALDDEREAWNLTRLALAGNALTQLNDTYFHLFNRLERVALGGNPWTCDCGVAWFQLVRAKLANSGSMRCVAPKRLRNREVLLLDADALPRCDVAAHVRAQKVLVAVIGVLVVLLLAVIVYLIYLAPHDGDRSARRIGQESPYSTIVLRDDL